MSTANGGPAFPQDNDAIGSPGMTLRDYFAGKALSTKTFSVRPYDTTREIAADCYRMADALLAERAK